MLSKRWRNAAISIFVVVWTVVFHYESTRALVLGPWLKRDLPKVKFLFPPAGWIMFFAVDNSFSYTEVYGVRNKVPQLIDPHQILETRTIGYDNIHRNVLSGILDGRRKAQVCPFLQRKFPEFEQFLITLVYYPDLTGQKYTRLQQIAYTCP